MSEALRQVLSIVNPFQSHSPRKASLSPLKRRKLRVREETRPSQGPITRKGQLWDSTPDFVLVKNSLHPCSELSVLRCELG